MHLSDLLYDFLEYLEVEQGRSQKTSENYHHYLARLIEFADDPKVGDIDAELIRKWRLWLNRQRSASGEPLSRQTQNYHLVALRSFLKYLAKRDIPTLGSDKVELARTQRREVTFLNGQEVARLFGAVDLSTAIGLRDRAILELLFSSGLRVSELTNLDRDHVNLDRREFRVRGKGGKDRPVFVSPEAADHMKNYLSGRTDNVVPLFIHAGTGGNQLEGGRFLRLTPRSIQRMVARYSRLAGLTKAVTPHTLRHSFATDLLMNGADLRSVQALLGHSNVSTTQIYTHVTDPQLREVHSHYHRKPRSEK
jgi:site-specific recombinase XerD